MTEAQPITEGGKPSPGTKPDARLKTNKPAAKKSGGKSGGGKK